MWSSEANTTSGPLALWSCSVLHILLRLKPFVVARCPDRETGQYGLQLQVCAATLVQQRQDPFVPDTLTSKSSNVAGLSYQVVPVCYLRASYSLSKHSVKKVAAPPHALVPVRLYVVRAMACNKQHESGFSSVKNGHQTGLSGCRSRSSFTLAGLDFVLMRPWPVDFLACIVERRLDCTTSVGMYRGDLLGPCS